MKWRIDKVFGLEIGIVSSHNVMYFYDLENMTLLQRMEISCHSAGILNVHHRREHLVSISHDKIVLHRATKSMQWEYLTSIDNQYIHTNVTLSDRGVLAFGCKHLVLFTMEWKQIGHWTNENVVKSAGMNGEGEIAALSVHGTLNVIGNTTKMLSQMIKSMEWHEQNGTLLTLDEYGTVKIWDGDYVCVVIPSEMELSCAMWMDKCARALSNDGFINADEDLYDWVVTIDGDGNVQFYKISDLKSKSGAPAVTPTLLRLKLPVEMDNIGNTVHQAVVRGLFAQNMVGNPSNIWLATEKEDGLMVVYRMAISNDLKQIGITNRIWQLGHHEEIKGILPHPYLPLVATWSNVLIVYATTIEVANKAFKCSGVVKNEMEGVADVKWCFRSTTCMPTIGVLFNNGDLHMYSLHPMQEKTKTCYAPNSPNAFPWTFYDEKTGKTGYEYGVDVLLDPKYGAGVVLDEFKKSIVVANFKKHPITGEMLAAEASGVISIKDEFVGVNDIRFKGKHLKQVLEAFRTIDCSKPATLKFRPAEYAPDVPMDDTYIMSKSLPVPHGIHRQHRCSLVTQTDVEDEFSPVLSGAINTLKVQVDSNCPTGKTCSTDQMEHSSWQRLGTHHFVSKPSLVHTIPIDDQRCVFFVADKANRNVRAIVYCFTNNTTTELRIMGDEIFQKESKLVLFPKVVKLDTNANIGTLVQTLENGTIFSYQVEVQPDCVQFLKSDVLVSTHAPFNSIACVAMQKYNIIATFTDKTVRIIEVGRTGQLHELQKVDMHNAISSVCWIETNTTSIYPSFAICCDDGITYTFHFCVSLQLWMRQEGLLRSFGSKITCTHGIAPMLITICDQGCSDHLFEFPIILQKWESQPSDLRHVQGMITSHLPKNLPPWHPKLLFMTLLAIPNLNEKWNFGSKLLNVIGSLKKLVSISKCPSLVRQSVYLNEFGNCDNIEFSPELSMNDLEELKKLTNDFTSLLFSNFSTTDMELFQVFISFVCSYLKLAFKIDACGIDTMAQRAFVMYMIEKEYQQRNVKYSLDGSFVYWSLCSNNQEFLIQNMIKQSSNWNSIKDLWPGLWIRDTSQLHQIMERYFS